MKQVLFFVYMGCLLFSAVMAFIYRKNLASRKLSVMMPLLLLTFIMEVCIAWYQHVSPKLSNAFTYNIYKLITVIVFASIYYSVPFLSRFRKLIIGITLLYVLSLIITYSFIDSIFNANSYLTFARGFCITFFAVFFLSVYFQLDNLSEEKYWHPLIWITTGIVIFYPVISISLAFHPLLRDYNATLYGFKLYQTIPQLMSIFMYSCFSYAFYLCKKKS